MSNYKSLCDSTSKLENLKMLSKNLKNNKKETKNLLIYQFKKLTNLRDQNLNYQKQNKMNIL